MSHKVGRTQQRSVGRAALTRFASGFWKLHWVESLKQWSIMTQSMDPSHVRSNAMRNIRRNILEALKADRINI